MFHKLFSLVPKPTGEQLKENQFKLDPTCRSFLCYNPATLEILGTSTALNKEEVVAKVQKGRDFRWPNKY
jgi:hypothetical protein